MNRCACYKCSQRLLHQGGNLNDNYLFLVVATVILNVDVDADNALVVLVVVNFIFSIYFDVVFVQMYSCSVQPLNANLN